MDEQWEGHDGQHCPNNRFLEENEFNYIQRTLNEIKCTRAVIRSYKVEELLVEFSLGERFVLEVYT